MVPLRPGIDDVELVSIRGSSIEIIGYVDVVFGAFGVKFKERCWVPRLELPFDIQLGNDRVVPVGHGIVSNSTWG